MLLLDLLMIACCVKRLKISRAFINRLIFINELHTLHVSAVIEGFCHYNNYIRYFPYTIYVINKLFYNFFYFKLIFLLKFSFGVSGISIEIKYYKDNSPFIEENMQKTNFQTKYFFTFSFLGIIWSDFRL